MKTGDYRTAAHNRSREIESNQISATPSCPHRLPNLQHQLDLGLVALGRRKLCDLGTKTLSGPLTL